MGVDPKTVVPHATTGSGPSSAFLGSDMRAAYYGGALTGQGQNVGLFEYAGTDLADMATYFTNIGQTNNVPVTLLSTDGTSTACVNSSGCDDTEQTLDMTQVIGMAPGLAFQPGGVCRIERYRDHQFDDDAQPPAHDERLFVGLDTGRPEHPQSVLREDGGARPKFLRSVRRFVHMEEQQLSVASRSRVRHLRGRHGFEYGRRRRRMVIGDRVGVG